MKPITKSILYILPIFILFIFNQNILRSINLNSLAMKVSKQNFGGQSHYTPIEILVSDSEFCNTKWLLSINEYSHRKKNFNESKFLELIDCSYIFVHMLSFRFPSALGMAEYAVSKYPEETLSYYWLANSIDPKTTVEKKPIYEKILSLNPNDGVAWRMLGIILKQQGNIPGAIEAHINCCNLGDPGVNGCYNAGRLLEQEGQFEEAIYYYRLSRWKPSQEAADHLEEILAGSD